MSTEFVNSCCWATQRDSTSGGVREWQALSLKLGVIWPSPRREKQMSIALFSVLGIVVGASLQYLFTRYLEERKHYRSLQTEAYADYLRGVAQAAHLNLTVNESEIFARIADAKTRVCLYGSQEVVKLLAQFESSGGIIGNEEQCEAFVAIIQAMRGDSNVESKELELILLGSGEERPAKKRLPRDSVESAAYRKMNQ